MVPKGSTKTIKTTYDLPLWNTRASFKFQAEPSERTPGRQTRD